MGGHGGGRLPGWRLGQGGLGWRGVTPIGRRWQGSVCWGVSVWQLSLRSVGACVPTHPTGKESWVGRLPMKRPQGGLTRTPTPPQPTTNPPASHPASGSAVPVGPCPSGGPKPPKVLGIFPPPGESARTNRCAECFPASRPPIRLGESDLGGPNHEAYGRKSFLPLGAEKRRHREKRQSNSHPPGPTLLVCCVAP